MEEKYKGIKMEEKYQKELKEINLTKTSRFPEKYSFLLI